jgi:acetyl-CoA carboxylase biotin carboxyl carrier protein
MTIEEIRELIRLAQESDVAELEVRFGNDSVRITLAGGKRTEMVLPTMVPVSVAPQLSAESLHVPPPPSQPPPREESDHTMVVKSPIVGTYYDSPSPSDAPFVKVGDHVHPKQVLCIIESMKLMNEIEAEVGGIVVAKLVENGRPVEYGESLFTIRPL